MTFDIATVFIITALAVILFITERVRVDLVALLVMASLALTDILTPAETLSGFSNAAVVTVWAVLILSAGLARTGVAGSIGHRVLRLAGSGEARLILLIMLMVGTLSGFMNSIGVASLFLPVVIDIARRTGTSPSKLLIPLSFAALMGGLITLIGTPPNILISEALQVANLQPFGMFDYTPVGIFVLIAGIVFIILLGRRLLPDRDISRETSRAAQADVKELYDLQDRMAMVYLPDDSNLAGKSLGKSRLGSILGLNVVAIIHEGQTLLAPSPETILQTGDRLLLEGRLDQLTDFHDRSHLIIEDEKIGIEKLISAEIELVELEIPQDSSLIQKTLRQIDFRQRYAVIVLAIRRGGIIWRTNLESIPLKAGDKLLVQGSHTKVDAIREDSGFILSPPQEAQVYQLEERLMLVNLPEDSSLVGKTLMESRLGDAFGLGVMGIIRQEKTQLMPNPEERLQAGDTLLVKGKREDLLTVDGLQSLQIETELPPDLRELESAEVGLVEAVLSPHTSLVGRTLREIHFRVKYGLSVLAIWREGRAYYANLGEMALRFGDALLLHGSRDRIRLLGSEPDFLVLTEDAQEAPRTNRAWLAVLIMAVVLLPVILGWVPIAIMVVVGVALMVLTGCLTMDEAYRAIEWKAVFLIAGMIPLGIAMEKTGAASFMATWMVDVLGGYGPVVIMGGLYILTSLASQVMPNPAAAVLLVPIALNTASDLGVSPYPLAMTVAVAASAAFLSPVGHPANLLVMGPGGYRFSDYIRIGLPLTLVLLVVVMLVMPIFWPF
ncbi:MAG: SLC13 family permease [Chloroflexota bacterium]|nr:MAG: SLC13 family permease [Chloroflexota bacterium]